ncbi:extracellular matrix regulator RemB [Acetonema longum]|uniref:DUF370 domain-containing protein n=1 Tax=Acetonema longum DSM 6540 TaxID=1009370 RepID=F7NFV8_9FIRM|nr:extracellular matrix/biofilm biosynthesis regulator RemA family protein [Acetonema longum]EGO65066.1 hypothetical protein ALO_04708 [Acetonema longum DSM 6540]
MFLHLGVDTVVPLNEVITINDIKENVSPVNAEFLRTMQEEHLIVDISMGHPKSFVVTDKKVYYSAISSLTLKKRAHMIFEADEIEE